MKTLLLAALLQVQNPGPATPLPNDIVRTPDMNAAIDSSIPPATATTDAQGNFAGSWPQPLSAAPSRGIATIYGNSVAYHCQLATMTPSGFTGKCWQIVSATLPTVPANLLGLVLSPIANPAAGLTVNVFARK